MPRLQSSIRAVDAVVRTAGLPLLRRGRFAEASVGLRGRRVISVGRSAPGAGAVRDVRRSARPRLLFHVALPADTWPFSSGAPSATAITSSSSAASSSRWSAPGCSRSPQSWLVYRLTGSSALLGVVGFARQIPVFLFAPIGGTVADRASRRRVIIATQTASMLLALRPSAALTLTGRVQVWHVFVLAALPRRRERVRYSRRARRSSWRWSAAKT